MTQDPESTATGRAPAHANGSGIPGEVRLMTERPVEIPADQPADGALQRLMEELDRRPWLAPAVLMGVLLLAVLLRRRDSPD